MKAIRLLGLVILIILVGCTSVMEENKEEVEEQAEKEEEEQVGLEEIAREVSNIPASGNVSYGLPEDSTPEQLQPEYFAQQTAYSPAQEVRERVERIWDYSQERDMTWREQQEVTGIVSGLERKADAGASGKYTSWSEEVAQEVILSKKIASQLLLTKSYDSSKSERGVQQDWYKGN